MFDQKNAEHSLETVKDKDEKLLNELGYEQQFKRSFSFWRTFSVSATILGLLPSLSAVMGYNFGYAGITGALWGWIAAAIPIQFVALSLAEICSSMPTDGGLYYAAAAMAPKGWGPLFAWIVGWSNFLAFTAAPLSILYANSLIILGSATVLNPTFTIENYQIYLMTLLQLIFIGCLLTSTSKFIGYINFIGMVWNTVIVFVFVIWVPAGNTGEFNSNSEVWSGGIDNGTAWPNGWAFLLGFSSVLYTLAGYDAPFHISEECSNANVAGPRAIVATAQIGLYLGWAILIAMAYTISNLEGVVAGPYGQPIVNFCIQVLGKKSGLALVALNIVALLFVAQGSLVYISRITFAYSRDGALPGSRWWKQINSRTKTPVNAAWLIVALDAIVGLLIFAGPIAINAVFTIVAFGQYVAFTIPIALKLFSGHKNFHPGPWNLGRFSRPVNAVAVCFGLLVVPILNFPAYDGSELTPQTMNWTCLLWGGCMVLALSWYALNARKWFKGPNVKSRFVQIE